MTAISRSVRVAIYFPPV